MSFFTPRLRSATPGAFQPCVGAEPAPGYRLVRVRGRGGFAEVWEAATPDGRRAALKFMLSSNAGNTARELRSVQSFQEMNHPCLVRTHGVWTVPGYVVIDMELGDATLLDWMLLYHTEFGRHLDPAELGLHMWQVAEGLDFLNTRRHLRDGRRVGFQHGDVKPNNVLLCGAVAKLTDYGLATPTHGPSTPCPRHGTIEYAAPEVFQGTLTDWSDQFSLAVTYCVLRTGAFPFPAMEAEELRKSYHRPPPELSAYAHHEKAALLRALAPVPQDRFPGCREFVHAVLRGRGLKIVRVDGDPRVVDESETIPDSQLVVPTGPSGTFSPPSGTLRPAVNPFAAPSGAGMRAPSGFIKTPSGFRRPG